MQNRFLDTLNNSAGDAVVGYDFEHNLPSRYMTIGNYVNARGLYTETDVETTFHNWLIEYEVEITSRWDALAPEEWQTLVAAQWAKLKAGLEDIRRKRSDGGGTA